MTESTLLQEIIRIMMGCWSSDSGKLFFNLEILPLPSQYNPSLLLFMKKNRNQYTVNSEILRYITLTQQNANFHRPSMNSTKYRKGVTI